MIEALFLLILVYLPFAFPWWVTLLFALLCIPSLYAMRRGPPFVPTPRSRVNAMLELANIQPGERIYDLGSGDGRIVRAAASKGAIATGFELSVFLYLYSACASLLTSKGHIRFADFWRRDYRDADVICCFLLRSAMREFEGSIWPQLRPGCRVVSHMFTMPGVEPAGMKKDVYLYVKPSLER